MTWHNRRVPRYDQLESCSDLSTEDAERAVTSAANLSELLARCAEIARSGEGCVRVLLVVARLARGDVPWLEGELRAALTPRGEDRSDLALYADLGFGLREPIVPRTSLPVPFHEIARAVALAPGLVAPLEVRREEARLVLARNASEGSALPPPIVEIEAAALREGAEHRASAAPTRPPTQTHSAAPGPETTVHSRPTIRASVADLEEILAHEAKRQT